METNDELKERVRREQRLAARLHLATERLEDAQRERIWALVEAHPSGLSIRQIAVATGLSSSRIHQLLGSEESREIPRWLSQRRVQEAAPSRSHSDLQAHLAGEMEALRRCREWLELLDRGETVVVNLRPETDPETEYVSFDRPRVLRVLARIIADLDELAGYPPIAEKKAANGEDAATRRARHRQRLAEPEPPPRRLTVREERAALRALLDLPPSGKG
jgi:AraC-like DNA-binding protein